ncbi:hypothetical protein N0V94_008093 [Neodidymelliopsis sp. IMI 364377]|nr:hypothetical protein N0V94_008093 [Neodidymelliopsis sp. IMI 364377]
MCSIYYASSVSVTDDVTVPNPTPMTEALDDEVVQPPPPIDFAAMSRTLATIAESLNESAEEAMYPSPPVNTPQVNTPAASIVYRYSQTRSRGFSAIGDRLARMKAEGRKFHHDSDAMSTSGRSMRSSMPADDESDGFSDMLSDDEKDRHGPLSSSKFISSPLVACVPSLSMKAVGTALDSIQVIPDMEKFISFTSNDLSDKVPVPFNSAEVVVDATEVTAVGIGTGSHKPHSQISMVSNETQDTGVTEMSTWKEEVEGQFERAFARLDQLAHDEHVQDPSKPVEWYYKFHLERLLNGGSRRIPVVVKLVGDAQHE